MSESDGKAHDWRPTDADLGRVTAGVGSALTSGVDWVKQNVVRPALMPLQMVGGAGQVGSLEMIALSLPGIVAGMTPKVRDELERQLRAWARKDEDINDELPEYARRWVQLAITMAPCALKGRGTLVQKLSISLSDVGRAVPSETADDGSVASIVLEATLHAR